MKTSLHKAVSPNTLNLIPWSDIVEYRDGNLFWKPGLTNSDGSNSNRYPTNKPLGSRMDSRGYRRFSFRENDYFVHRVVWFLHHGPILKGQTIDHIDRNPSNNTIENLRLANSSQQSANGRKRTLSSRSASNPSRWKGLSSHRDTGHWRLFVKGQYKGLFRCEYDAATAYNFFAAEIFGPYASLNSTPQPFLEE